MGGGGVRRGVSGGLVSIRGDISRLVRGCIRRCVSSGVGGGVNRGGGVGWEGVSTGGVGVGT